MKTAATGAALQPVPPGTPEPYERRCLEETTLYQLVQEHLETFLAQVEQETGAGLTVECGVYSNLKNKYL